jgi:hypothetical protein
MKRLLIYVLVLLLGIISVGNAQEKRPQPSGEEIQQQMEKTFAMMVPMMGKMVEAMIEAQLSVVSKPESAEKMARYVKNFQEALVKQGFSREEALRIVTSLPMPSASPSSK